MTSELPAGAFDAARRARARAEFAEWDLIAQHHGRRVAEIDRSDEIVLGKDLARREVTLEIAQALKVSERRVWAVVFEAETLHERTPVVWAEETAKALEERRVSVTHNSDGTSWLNALLPTGLAITAAERLRRAAKAEPAIHAETGLRDTRTRDQKQADLLGQWLTSCTGTTTDIRAEIAISISATDLVGYTEGPGLTRDGEPLDAAWVRELAASEHTVFRRLVLDPVGRVMDTTVLAYRPTEALRKALHWRDGTCRVAGCRAPVFETDLDHAQDYDSGGETSARNLRCLCRKHHNMKSHGHLDDRFLGDPATYGRATP